MKTTITKHQMKTCRKDYTGSDGRAETIIVNIRYDDECGNGHNTFAMTAEIYTQDRQPGEPKRVHKNGKTVWMYACGCQHEEIAKHFPDLRKYLKWHLCDSNGPMHYVANTIYHTKARNLNAARNTAIWQDATDEDLTAPGLEDRLKARLPKLLEDFKADMEALGFVF